jgi:hypothetical protein
MPKCEIDVWLISSAQRPWRDLSAWLVSSETHCARLSTVINAKDDVDGMACKSGRYLSPRGMK